MSVPNTRCIATKQDGMQCQHITLRGNMCPQHLDSVMGLRIGPSEIAGAGYGLFTTRARVKGENIVRYTGLVVLELEPDSDEEDNYSGTYVLMVKKTYPRVYIDAREPVNTGGFVNSSKGSGKRNNCQFVYDARRRHAWVRARAKIDAGKELYVAYGSPYWR